MRLFDAINRNGVYIIAEMSANHAGSLDNALSIVRAAKEAGADCLKVQTYTADTMTIDCDNEYFSIKNGPWAGQILYGLYQSAAMPWEWNAAIKAECEKLGLDFLATPYDSTAVDFLESLGAEFYKIASFELVDIPLVEYIASKGKPIILSCGMASPDEIEEAINAARSQGNDRIVLLKCCSEYPARDEDMNLAAIPDMRKRFSVPVGFSDHSLGLAAAVAAVSLGACVIEKHLCLSRGINSADRVFSMEPYEFKEMVQCVRRVKLMLGEASYRLSGHEMESMVFRRSIFVVKDIAQGEMFTQENCRVIRPGYGLEPKFYDGLPGMHAAAPLRWGDPVSFRSIKKGAVMFLTNNTISSPVYDWLRIKGDVFLYRGRLTARLIESLEPSFIVSYSYKYIIPRDIIDMMPGKIVNLHISLLPWNRGAAPNFFSFIEDTPMGVTIHNIDEGVDTGDILCSKEVLFDEMNETFESTYRKLHQAMRELFFSCWGDIRQGKLTPQKQPPGGSRHTVAQFTEIAKKYPFAWSDNIAEFKQKYRL